MIYTHLSIEQRYKIDVLRQQGLDNSKIAEVIGVHPTTVGREIKRNGRNGRYGAQTANRRSEDRRHRASSRRRSFTAEMRQRIDQMLRNEQWSPEQIRDRLRAEGHASISHEWIYLYIWEDQRNGGDLHTHLRQAKKKRRKRYGSKHRRGPIANRVSIDERPAIVETRSRIGDWELDTIIGAEQQGALVTIVERKSRYVLMRRVTSTKAEEVTATIIAMMREHRSKLKTMTADNGHEFAQHEKITKALGAPFYFAHPYHSWERGTNENTNGLIRQYFPKNTNFLHVSAAEVAAVEKKINNRPRAVLESKTAHEVFFASTSVFFQKTLT